MSLVDKVEASRDRIREWYEQWDGNVYISFSGGKDSTVLMNLVREIYPDVTAVFSNTGLEYPEIRQFVSTFENVDLVKPKLVFPDIIRRYGYPLASKEVAGAIKFARRHLENGYRGGHTTILQKRKELLGLRKETANGRKAYSKERWLYLVETPFLISDYCCEIMKKSPMQIYERATGRHPILGTLAEESSLRKHSWLQYGCNSYDGKHVRSTPMAFWTEQDVLRYIKENNLPICSVYGDVAVNQKGELYTTGVYRTGCEFCAFGLQNEIGETRFQKLKRTHPKQYDYCFSGGQWVPNPEYDPKYTDEPDEMGWVEWNPEKIWVPSKDGLGMGFVFDKVNELYGKYYYRYQ